MQCYFKCVVSQNIGNLKTELQKEILKRATIYSDEDKMKNFNPYIAAPKVGKGDQPFQLSGQI